MISELFSAIDSKDATKFASFLAEGCVLRFGNLPEVRGVTEIRNFVSGFFDSIDSLSHRIEESWSVPDGLVCHGLVSYVRKNGASLTVPFVNIFGIGSAGIDRYLIFVDTSALYT
jgi:hypothetical protein